MTRTTNEIQSDNIELITKGIDAKNKRQNLKAMVMGLWKTIEQMVPACEARSTAAKRLQEADMWVGIALDKEEADGKTEHTG